MEPWICDRCQTIGLQGETRCQACGAPRAPAPPAPASAVSDSTWGGVAVVRAVQDDTVMAAALAGPSAGTGRREPLPAEPFFQLAAPPRRRRRRERLTRWWPVLVLVVVLLFFAIAGLSRTI